MARERENLPVEVRPYRVGLTLSGGGAKGFAHVGALKAMEELGIRPDIISGTSAGAVIAVLYADGYSPDEILDLFSGLSFNDLAEITLPRSCFFKIDRFKHFLQKSLRAVNIEDLSIPVVVTATDLDHGKYVAWRSGEIAERVTASCSIPIIFPPVLIDGTHYVDGSNVIEDMKLCDLFIPMKEAARYAVFDIHALRDIANVGYQQTLKLFTGKHASKINELNK